MRLTRRVNRPSLWIAVVALVAAQLLALATPAAAKTIYDNYYRTTGDYAGTVGWYECTCSWDHTVTIQDRADGLWARQAMHYERNGVWYEYWYRLTPDGYQDKEVVNVPRGKIRMQIRMYRIVNDRWQQEGPSWYWYTWHS